MRMFFVLPPLSRYSYPYRGTGLWAFCTSPIHLRDTPDIVGHTRTHLRHKLGMVFYEWTCFSLLASKKKTILGCFEFSSVTHPIPEHSGQGFSDPSPAIVPVDKQRRQASTLYLDILSSFRWAQTLYNVQSLYGVFSLCYSASERYKLCIKFSGS